MAAAALGRLLFLPTADEVAMFEAFEHDVNLGTDDLFQLLDIGPSRPRACAAAASSI